MPELETVKEIKEETKETEPKLILGQVPCFNAQLMGAIWNIIKPHVKKFADESAGEYSINDIWQSIYFGKSFVYFSYLSKDEKDIEYANRGNEFANLLADEKDIEYANRGNEFANLLALRYLTQKKEKDFCAFMIIRFDPDSVHIWNAYIFPEYQNTNIFGIGYQAVEKVLKDIGTPAITFSSSPKRLKK
jgi:hypothetical protein